MITIAASDTIAGVAATGANEVTCTLSILELHSGTGVQTYIKDQQQLAAAAATIYTATANGPSFVRSIYVVNTDTANTSTFQLFAGGTAAANAITPVWTLPAGGSATYEDGEGWTFHDNQGVRQMLGTGGGWSLLNIQQFLAAGTYTYHPTPGMKNIMVICTGGGGGAGGCATAAGGSADVGIATGGGAGGTSIGFFTAATVGNSKIAVVGAGGDGHASSGFTGGAASGGNGTAGGDSTWNSTSLVGSGGSAGTGSAATTQDSQMIAGVAGGGASGGTLNITGGSSTAGVAGSADMATVDLTFGIGGTGGTSFWGGANRASTNALNVITTDAIFNGRGAGMTPGAGGSAGVNLNTAGTGASGGDGADGAIIVIEFI